MSEIAQTDNFNDKTNIKVVGVGGAGGNAVNRMIAEGLQSVEFIAINTDAKDLMRSDADVKISLNDATSRGLGAGADPEKGAKAAQDHQSDIEESLKGADMVFVTCGEGGGTGTGASPIVARAAHQQGALTIAVVTRPFSFEGFDANSKKAAQAEAQKQAEPAESTVPLSALSAAPRAAAVPQQPQPQLIQTPEAPKVQPLSTYIPSTPEPVVPSFDQTTEHEVVSSNDAGDLDIPDFLR